jgi:hypothetical protein
MTVSPKLIRVAGQVALMFILYAKSAFTYFMSGGSLTIAMDTAIRTITFIRMEVMTSAYKSIPLNSSHHILTKNAAPRTQY